MGRTRLAKNKALPPNLYENSAGYFYYINPRSKKSKGLGRDRMKAVSEARAANAALAAMKPSSLADWVTGKQDYTLAEWVPMYRELWIAKEARADNTLRSANMYLPRIAAADFAWMSVREVTTAHVAKFIAEAEKTSGAPTAKLLRARMSDVFRWAETQGLIDQGANPVTATYAPDAKVRRERLSLEQFQAIRELAPVWLKRAMNLALMTAQRRDDVAGMKFSDSRDGFLFIAQGKSQGSTRLQQDVNIRLAAVGMSIADAIQQCRDLIVSRYLIHHTAHQGTARPGDRVASNGMSNAFQEARDAAGIVAAEGRTPPTFHEIRSLSERLYRVEYGAEFAQAMLGHKNASTTAGYNDLRGQGYQVIAAK